MQIIELNGADSWREYDFGERVYRIEKPVRIYVGKTTHRGEGADGVFHVVPAPGLQGCVVRFEGKVIS